MKRDTIMSEFDFSYEELRGLEAHYRNMQKKTVINKIKRTPALAFELLRRLRTESWSTKPRIDSSVDQDHHETEARWPLGSP